MIVTMVNPPVNTLGRPLRRDLLAALENAEADPTIKAVVVTGRGNFSAGADLAEFDSGEGLAEPTLHLTIAGYLDSMKTPTIAAITGVALGGGLELALACSARIAERDSRLGLPETTLGFMPGAGGTQRLPRAIGIEAALDLIMTGRSVDGSQALSMGLVDAIDSDVIAAAIAMAARLAASASASANANAKPRLRDDAVEEPLAEALVEAARRSAARNPRVNAGVLDALAALSAAVTLPFDKGLAREFELFRSLALQPEARAARYRFLSERAAGRVPTPDESTTPVSRAAVVGAGTMGRGITLALLGAGVVTTIIDTDLERVDSAVAAIAAELERSVSKGRLSGRQRDEQLASLTGVVGLDGAADVDAVIEAVFEDLQVKIDVFAQLDSIARPGTILASNTSSLDLNLIAGATKRPESVVGMHFFSPANIMKLVEVVNGAHTAPATLASTVALAKRMKKIPVVAEVGPGFIGNRIFDQYLRQANSLVLEGLEPSRVDRVLEAWGMAMGPFRVLDVIGNDVPWMARRAAPGAKDPAWAIADAVAERGWFGRKSGIGWYRYAADGSSSPNSEVGSLYSPGRGDRAIDDAEIVERCVLAMVREAADVLEAAIAASSADVDTVMVNGYGFPARHGGPWFFASDLGFDRANRAMVKWARVTSDPFWEPSTFLRSREDRPTP
nr:3-hydroxyacyl-CoA dehydrogenase NAD-binding domain-containing protein [Galbitalea soli]